MPWVHPMTPSVTTRRRDYQYLPRKLTAIVIMIRKNEYEQVISVITCLRRQPF